MHLQLSDPLISLEMESMMMLQIARECLRGGVGVSTSKCTPTDSNRPSLMVTANCGLTTTQIAKIVKVVARAFVACQPKTPNNKEGTNNPFRAFF